MANNATHDMLEVTVNVGGYAVTGMGPGTPLRPARNVPAVQTFTGIGGLGGFAKQLDQSGSYELDIVMTSDDNAVFTRFHRFNMATPGGIGFSFSVFSPATSFVIPVAMFAAEAKGSIGDVPGVLTWTILGIQTREDHFGKGPTPTTEFGDLPELADIPQLFPPR